MQESAVSFDTASRIHVALAARNLEQSIAYYRALFGQEPAKLRPGYAKFEVAEPPVNLSLNEFTGPTTPGNSLAHFGIQVKSTAAVWAVQARMQEAVIETEPETQVTCCYAVQNKVWTNDPDGNRWEVYVVLDNDAARRGASPITCCPDPSSNMKEASQR